ncbi:MAG: hypothetical protein GF418_16045 [Chitinivibrionales bacterium]|nr:hypothetical protein [Chitinivibrionales bacterium]
MVYAEESELRERMRRAKLPLKRAAQELNMRPGTLSAKLTGWSYLSKEERRGLISVIQSAEEIANRNSIGGEGAPE